MQPNSFTMHPTLTVQFKIWLKLWNSFICYSKPPSNSLTKILLKNIEVKTLVSKTILGFLPTQQPLQSANPWHVTPSSDPSKRLPSSSPPPSRASAQFLSMLRAGSECRPQLPVESSSFCAPQGFYWCHFSTHTSFEICTTKSNLRSPSFLSAV